MSETLWADRVERESLLEIASKLIAIPSPSGEERVVMDWVTQWCDAQGLSYHIVAKDPARPNVIITVGDPASGPVLVMNGHLDTVPVSDPDVWRSDPYAPTVTADGKKLVGRGASDMKSSTGVMLAMMALFKDSHLTGALQAHIVSDEELSANFGTIAVLDAVQAGNLPRPDYCLIGEKSDLKVRNAERGLVAFDVTVFGRASHTAAARATGINAIAKAAKAILAIEHDIDKFHPAIGKPVISVNTIKAGVAHNVVPGECSFSIDRRLIPGETSESALAEIRAAMRSRRTSPTQVHPSFRRCKTAFAPSPEPNRFPSSLGRARPTAGFTGWPASTPSATAPAAKAPTGRTKR